MFALAAFFIARKIRSNDGNVKQNATRDPSEGLKLEADGSVLQQVMSSFQSTPNSVANGTHDLSLGESPIEVGYSDRPRSRNGHRNGTSNGNIL